MQQSHPILAEKLNLPDKKGIDGQLVLGLAIFGIGWGLVGYCPGPAITALGLSIMDAVYFVIDMIISAFIYQTCHFLFK